MLRGCAALMMVMVFSLAKAQYNPVDTFRIYLKKQPDFYVSLDGRNSFVRDKPAVIDGLRFGFSYGGKIRLLAGLYILRDPIYRNYLYAQGTPAEEWRLQRSDFMYLSFTCDYVVYKTNRWKLAVPVQTGFGFGNRLEKNMAGEIRQNRNLQFIPFEVSLSASYRVLPWLSAGAGLGYRYALFSNAISADFSAPIYTYGIGLDPVWFWERYGKDYVKKSKKKSTL